MTKDSLFTIQYTTPISRLSSHMICSPSILKSHYIKKKSMEAAINADVYQTLECYNLLAVQNRRNHSRFISSLQLISDHIYILIAVEKITTT